VSASGQKATGRRGDPISTWFMVSALLLAKGRRRFLSTYSNASVQRVLRFALSRNGIPPTLAERVSWRGRKEATIDSCFLEN